MAKKRLILCLVILIVGIGQSVNSEVKEIPSQDRVELGSHPIMYGANESDVLDPDFGPKGSEPQYYLPKGEPHTGVVLQSSEADLPLWGSDRNFGPAYGVSMDVVSAGSYQGRIFVATLRLHFGSSDTIFTYYSDDNGSSWNNWWKIYTYSGWQFNDFSIACSRSKLAVINQFYSSSKEYLYCYIFDFSSGYEGFYIDSTSSPTSEMHPDICSDAEDYSNTWFYLVYSKPITRGTNLCFKAFDESGGVIYSANFAGSGDYLDGDIDYDNAFLYVAHYVSGGKIYARSSLDLGYSWEGPWEVGFGNNDSKPRIAGHSNHVVVVMEDANLGINYRYSTDAGYNWSSCYGELDAGDDCPAITEANDRYGVYYSNEAKEAHRCYLNFTSSPLLGDITIGDAWANARVYAHCYEIKYLWSSSNVGVVWIDDRTGSWHAWFDAGDSGGGIEEVFSQELSHVRFQNYPNPVFSRTAIKYSIPEKSKVELKVYDASGKEIVTLLNKEQSAGFYTVNWDIRDISRNKLPNGVYFYQLKAGDFAETKKMVIVR